MTGKAVNVAFTASVISIAFKTNPLLMLQLQHNMVRFNPTNGTNNSVALTGLATNETIVGIDFRPANGSLYAVSTKVDLL
jgi:hypothetical protein